MYRGSGKRRNFLDDTDNAYLTDRPHRKALRLLLITDQTDGIAWPAASLRQIKIDLASALKECQSDSAIRQRAFLPAPTGAYNLFKRKERKKVECQAIDKFSPFPPRGRVSRSCIILLGSTERIPVASNVFYWAKYMAGARSKELVPPAQAGTFSSGDRRKDTRGPSPSS